MAALVPNEKVFLSMKTIKRNEKCNKISLIWWSSGLWMVVVYFILTPSKLIRDEIKSKLSFFLSNDWKVFTFLVFLFYFKTLALKFDNYLCHQILVWIFFLLNKSKIGERKALRLLLWKVILEINFFQISFLWLINF